jgi:hypothetical protein
MWALLAIVVWALFFIVLIWIQLTRQPKSRPQQSVGVPAFSSLPDEGGRAFGAFSASLILHLLIVFCLPNLPRLMPAEAQNQVRARLLPPAQTALILRLPERVYIVATVTPQAERRPSASVAKPHRVPAAPRPTSTTRRPHGAPRFLPPVPSVLLQPNRPVAADIRSLKLPSFLYWSANRMQPPPRPIDPGSAPKGKPGVSAARRDVVSPPNQERRSAAISVASAPRISTQAPTLPANSSAGPWGLIAHGSSPEEFEAMAHRMVGDLVAVGAASTSQSSRRENVEIPPLNQPGTTSVGSPNDARGDSQGAEQKTARAPASAVPAGGNSAPGGDSGAHSDPPPAVRILNTHAGPVEVHEFSDGSQQWRFPATGSFDVVIVQRSAGAMIPEAEPLLTGWPVQTVYLALGTAKEWIMQYCLPPSASAPAAQSGMLVTLGKPAKLEAPFIQLAMLPPPKITNSSRPALFSGSLGADGRFRRLRPVVAPDYETRPELLPYIEQWLFRPAKWDGAFAEVDVVLLVPASTGG